MIILELYKLLSDNTNIKIYNDNNILFEGSSWLVPTNLLTAWVTSLNIESNTLHITIDSTK